MKKISLAALLIFSTSQAAFAFESDHYTCTSNDDRFQLEIVAVNRPDLDLNDWDSSKDTDSITVTFTYKEVKAPVTTLTEASNFTIKTSNYVDGNSVTNYTSDDDKKICPYGATDNDISLNVEIQMNDPSLAHRVPLSVQMTCRDVSEYPQGAVDCFDNPNNP